ncbi:MAG TPA: ABC transporter ATP-binding protein [Verrucomicrobiae bacterium]|jgi:phospholipid/cholesterol/gamma-HCH transport system ATP-binding protein
MIIEARNVEKSFDGAPVLRGVSFSVEKGEALAVIGISGGGKSVLLKHLVGLLTPDAGEVIVGGIDIACLDERQLLPVRRQFGMLFQGAALFDSLTVEDNIAFVLNRERRFTRQEIDQRVEEVLDVVGLNGTQKKWPAELSGGMRKRVGLARAIIYRPDILLYDEPTTGLDPIAADAIDHLIMRVVQQFKVTSIAVTHDMRSARRIGRRILMLHEGRVYADETPEKLFKSTDPIIHRFVNGISELAGVI